MTIAAEALWPDSKHQKLARLEAVLWPAIIAIGLIPIWTFAYYPSVDGPAHLALMQALTAYSDPARPAYQQFFELRTILIPNLFMHLSLGGLMQMVDPLTAEKLFLSAYLIAFPLALRYAARAFGPEAGFIGLLGVPIAHHALLTFGFYNTSFGIVFFLFTFGFWLRHSERGSLKALLGYAVLGLLCFLCHLSAVLMSVAAIALTTLSRSLAEVLRRRLPLQQVGQRFIGRALLPAIGFLPAIGLALDFLLSGGRATKTVTQIADVSLPAIDRLLRFITGSIMVQHDSQEILAGIVFMLGLAGLFALVLLDRTRRPVDSGLMGFAFAALGFLLIAPFAYHVRWIPLRLEPYVLLAFVLWLASRASGSSAAMRATLRGITIGLVLAVIVSATVVRYERVERIDGYLRELVALGSEIEPGSTLLALPLSRALEGRPVSDRHFIMIQAGSFVAIAAEAIDLKNFQAHTSVVPLVFRPEVRPWTYLASDHDFLATPLEVDITGYRQSTGQAVDYVILFGDPSDFPDDPQRHRVTRALAADYTLVRESAPLGFGQLYRFNGGE